MWLEEDDGMETMIPPGNFSFGYILQLNENKIREISTQNITILIIKVSWTYIINKCNTIQIKNEFVYFNSELKKYGFSLPTYNFDFIYIFL